MNTLIVRDVNSLTIRASRGNGCAWAVTKKITKTDTVYEAVIKAPSLKCTLAGAVQRVADLRDAIDLAHQMDEVFKHHADFDRIRVAEYPTSDGRAAWIVPDDEHIVIGILAEPKGD